jgi:YhcH/YjgK/YiaL family protein
MIVDKIEFIERYVKIERRIKDSLYLLKNIETLNLTPGKHNIDGDSFFYIVNEYETIPVDQGVYESHKKYLDIHSMIFGNELIGYSEADNLVLMNDYNLESDYSLYKGKNDGVLCRLNLSVGVFAIFFPGELHMPGISKHKTSVKKIVFKIKI